LDSRSDVTTNPPILIFPSRYRARQIPEHAIELKAAANFPVANYGRHKIISMPRSVPKIAIFEEAARTLDIPGGTKMISKQTTFV
jgi:hypothetical protein